jgi:glycosyltransferase involved in cell wall biosynthesis
MFSVVILTKNESLPLPRALKSLTQPDNFCDDVFVVDSGSTDDTVKTAESLGAKVIFHSFESFGRQRQWALENLPLKYDWVLFLDADEYATKRFLDAVQDALKKHEQTAAAFDCCWKLLLNNRWLRFSDNFPRYQTRLVHRHRATFGDWGHGQKLASCSGARLKIDEPYLHDAFVHGWQSWWQKHERYALLEAEAMRSGTSGDRITKLKTFLRQLPFWPFLLFIVRYFFLLGFLDGKEGFIWCVNRSKFEGMVLKAYCELQKTKH